MLAIQFGLQVGGCSGQFCQGLTGRVIGQLAGDLLLQLEMFLCLLLQFESLDWADHRLVLQWGWQALLAVAVWPVQ